jgi:hypothetical protein
MRSSFNSGDSIRLNHDFNALIHRRAAGVAAEFIGYLFPYNERGEH